MSDHDRSTIPAASSHIVQAIAARILHNPAEASAWRAQACDSLPCDCPRTAEARGRCPIFTPALVE